MIRYERVVKDLQEIFGYMVNEVAIEKGHHREKDAKLHLSILEKLIEIAELTPGFPEEQLKEIKVEYGVLKEKIEK